MVSIGVLDEIELMVVLRIPPLTSFDNLRNDLFTCDVVRRSELSFIPRETRGVEGDLTLRRKVLGLNLLCDALCNGELVIRMCEDGRTVFCER